MNLFKSKATYNLSLNLIAVLSDKMISINHQNKGLVIFRKVCEWKLPATTNTLER